MDLEKPETIKILWSALSCKIVKQTTVKSRLSERRLSETTGLFEDDG